MTRSAVGPPPVGELFRPEGGERQASTKGPRLLLLLHDECAECASWSRRRLGPVVDAIARWGGRIVRLESAFRAEHPDTGWLAVTDEWDEVFHLALIGTEHVFPDPAELADWVRFVAIQCPECEGPEGPWCP